MSHGVRTLLMIFTVAGAALPSGPVRAEEAPPAETGTTAAPEGETREDPPVVESTDPKDGDAVRYFLYQFPRPIRVAFSKEMDKASVERAFSTSPRMDGAFSWDGNTVTFTPASYPLTNEMTVTVGKEAMDTKGIPLREPYTFRYRLVIME